MLYSLLPLMLQMGVGVSDPAYPDHCRPVRSTVPWGWPGWHTGRPAQPEKKARRKAQQHARRQQHRYDNRRRK